MTKLDTAILLVSDITKGMKSIGSKALLEIDNGIAALDHQISYIKKYYRPKKIILCTGFDHDRIVHKTRKYKNIEYSYNDNYAIDNQSGSLIRCLQQYEISNAMIITNGLILFDKIYLENYSSTYFINSNRDKKKYFDIGTNTVGDPGYLFYDLNYKWIETSFIHRDIIDKLREKNIKITSKLFLFELLNNIIEDKYDIKFIKLDHQKIYPIKINCMKDLTNVKKYYKKYKFVSN